MLPYKREMLNMPEQSVPLCVFSMAVKIYLSPFTIYIDIFQKEYTSLRSIYTMG